MKPIITVRRYDDRLDNHKVKQVIRNFVLSRFSGAFWFCLFREVNELWRFSRDFICIFFLALNLF